MNLQPYVQTSVATRASDKLSFCYFGPYFITAKIGSVAYKLLPDSSSIHPVFHVSQLKKDLPPSTQVSSDIPNTTETDAFQFPVKVLQCRLKTDGDHMVAEVLIQWSSWPPSMATWEFEDELKHQFPAAPAWGQVGSQDGRNVSSSVPARRKHQASKDNSNDGVPTTTSPAESGGLAPSTLVVSG